MDSSPPDKTACGVLFVTDTNLLDDTFESSGQRALLQSLNADNLSCVAVCRFVIPGGAEGTLEGWLRERGLKINPDVQLTHSPPGDQGRICCVEAHSVTVFLWASSSTKPHALEEAERTAFLKSVEAVMDAYRPEVVVARLHPTLGDVLSSARRRGLVTVAQQAASLPAEPAALRDADVVLAPSRFAADYVREGFGNPCVNLPPAVAVEALAEQPAGPGAVIFDGSVPGSGLAVLVQIAEALGRRRPDVPVIVLGGSGSVPLPQGSAIRCIPHGAAGQLWNQAGVMLAPVVGYDLPASALSALSHGVPVIASDRGAAPELLDGSGLLLPLPDRLTAAFCPPLQPAELAPWVEAIVQFYDDPGFAARQRSLALLAGQRFTVTKTAPQYARFFRGLTEARNRRHQVSSNGHAKKGDGSHASLRRLAETYAWPDSQPEDAAPGQEQGWLGAGTELVLARVVKPTTQLVVELGSWLGLSTRYLADLAPQATVVSVDHWKGSSEHQNQERYRHLLPRLYETFLARSWDYRDRVVPLRMSTLDGLRKVAEFGLQPNVIFFDAEHTFEAVTAELTLARQLFPKADLCGDDYDWRGVREGVNTFARRHGLTVDRFGTRGWRLLESWNALDANRLPPGRAQSTVLVPHMGGIDWECEQALRQLEGAGVRVVRRGGCSAIENRHE